VTRIHYPYVESDVTVRKCDADGCDRHSEEWNVTRCPSCREDRCDAHAKCEDCPVVVDGLAIDANGGRVRMVRDGAETYFSPATARTYADLLALSEIGSPLVAALLDAAKKAEAQS